MKSLGFIGFLLALVLPTIFAAESFTAAEIKALKKFRVSEKDVLYEDYMKTDDYLIRWLRAKNLNLPQASEMLRTALKWRKDNKVDNILEETFAIENTFPYTIDAVDKEGRPVLQFAYGTWNLRKIVLAGQTQQLHRFLVKQIEDAVTKVRELNATNPDKNVKDFIVIMDMNGYNLRQHFCVGCLPSYLFYVNTYDNYYPQMAYKVMIINAPAIFDTLLQILRPIMSPHLRNSLTVYTHNKDQWQKDILKLIPSDQLTAQYGGTKV